MLAHSPHFIFKNQMSRPPSSEQRVEDLENFVNEVAFVLNHTDKSLTNMVTTIKLIKYNLQVRTKQCETQHQELL